MADISTISTHHPADGGYSDNMPVLDAHTVTVSPFSGGADICPPDHTAAWVSVSNTRVSVSADNFLRVASVLFPPEHASLARVCCQGFSDALRFLETRAAAVPWRVWSLARSEEAWLLQITKVTRMMGRHLLHVHTIESMLVCLIITKEFELGAGAPEHGLQLLVSRLPCGAGLLQLGRAQVRNTLVRHTASRVSHVSRGHVLCSSCWAPWPPATRASAPPSPPSSPGSSQSSSTLRRHSSRGKIRRRRRFPSSRRLT